MNAQSKLISRAVIVVLTALMVTGCSLRMPGLGIDIGDGGKRGGSHCPPGQAKKGNC
jgi:predicted small secreted protein